MKAYGTLPCRLRPHRSSSSTTTTIRATWWRPEALRYLREGGPVRLIVLDMHLPGMDGHAFLRELRASPAHAAVPVVVFSGDAGNGIEGTAGFVRKGSDDPDRLLRVIADALK
jgi:CheY-like chemotaxis protein